MVPGEAKVRIELRATSGRVSIAAEIPVTLVR
jgi:hypothetical protein